eukprot:TRINITY_DN56664_c0_g1_i1.p1 TRINITY_DN56664_c0_g1~~TRINITY_DN56664_c0_g1_i1.p1  ORF type:complete len:446 (-),score=92.11 TRINITY_DN56664_c0_g1_i1:24-1361(-)
MFSLRSNIFHESVVFAASPKRAWQLTTSSHLHDVASSCGGNSSHQRIGVRRFSAWLCAAFYTHAVIARGRAVKRMVAGYPDNGNGKAAASGHDKEVDMRSDTVTQPTEPMRQAMATAVVGDDVFGDDPTVQALERRVADLFSKEAALFVTSGTMGNLIACGVHCSGRGQEVICGKDSHTFFYEQGGASSLMGVVFNTLPNQPDGTIDLDEVRKAIKPDDPHFAEAKLLILENTHNRMGGKVLSVDYMNKASALCKELGLKLHIDGARLWHAATALDCKPVDLVRMADTVTVCLSKGLGAPVGSVLAGPADFIRSARRLRKALGGGMRQAGVLAAAGLFAIDYNITRLKEDHINAQRLAKGLIDLGLHVVPADTNMVFWEVDNAPQLAASLQKAGVRVLCTDGNRRCRAVANLHVTATDIDRVIAAVADALASGAHGPAPKRSRTE